MVQRGLSPSDQYKVQVDVASGTPSVTCVMRDEGTVTSNPPAVPIVAGHWVRVRCQRVVSRRRRERHADRDLSRWRVRQPGRSAVTFRPIANLNFAIATSTSPVPLSIGAKVHNAALSVITPDSDQFNGQIDNVYLSIP